MATFFCKYLCNELMIDFNYFMQRHFNLML
jgi:hypothetical protein